MPTKMVNYRIEEDLISRFNAAAEGAHGKKGASVKEVRKFMERYASNYERKQSQVVADTPDS